MTEPPTSPWAQSGPDGARPEFVLDVPASPAGTSIERGGAALIGAPIELSAPVPSRDGRWHAGNVTGGRDLAVVIEPLDPDEPPIDDAARARRTYKWFGGVAAVVLAAGVVVLLMLIMTGRSPFHQEVSGPPDVAPPLARACPPPSNPPLAPQRPPAAPPGNRTVDARSGISYKAYGAPWRTWDQNWSNGGELKVSYRTGQYFVTETYSGGYYLASILSGSVPAADNDALTLDLKCTGHQVAADVRSSYYPVPNAMQTIKDEAVVLGGRPAWVDEFRLRFDAPGLKAKDELVAVALIDVGRPEAAILYISIPGTHRQYDYVIDEVLASVRPATR